jgi:hypothetical protein
MQVTPVRSEVVVVVVVVTVVVANSKHSALPAIVPKVINTYSHYSPQIPSMTKPCSCSFSLSCPKIQGVSLS